MQSLPTVISSLSLFVGFERLQIPYSKIINDIGATTFGIYLIHDYPLMRELLWGEVQFSGLMLVVYAFIKIVSIFVLCSFIERIRIVLIEKQYMKLLIKLDH